MTTTRPTIETVTGTAETTPAWLTPAEMAERTGVTIDTLRYYEREGLLTEIARAASGHRRYRNDDVLWVEVLRCLRDTGMSIEQLRHYCDLGQQGDHTQPDRRQMLTEHRSLIEAQIAERHEALRLIDHKLRFYPVPARDDGGPSSNADHIPDSNEET